MQPNYPPFPNSYWIIEGSFLAGPYPGDRDPTIARTKLLALRKAGISAIVNLMEPWEVDHGGNSFVSYEEDFKECISEKAGKASIFRFPIRDLSIPKPETMVKILDQVDALLEAGIPLYVHCWGGIGRTGTVVGCWLIRHGKGSAKNVLGKIGELRKNSPNSIRPSPETREQINFVQNWHERNSAE